MADVRPLLVAPAVWSVPIRSPTLPPATHTNCYLVGSRELVVVDPAATCASERAVLDRAIREIGLPVSEVWLTHHHPDHIGDVARLAGELGAVVAAHPETSWRVAPRIRVQRLLSDGECHRLPGNPSACLQVVVTPGHAPGHCCFLEQCSGMLLAGDMVASVGTIVVDPDEGDMRQYLASLARLKALAPAALLPAHGEPIADAVGKLDEYTAHRLWREQRVWDALSCRGRATAGALVAPVYEDVAEKLFPLAERSLIAHLIKLKADGRVGNTGKLWFVEE